MLLPCVTITTDDSEFKSGTSDVPRGNTGTLFIIILVLFDVFYSLLLIIIRMLNQVTSNCSRYFKGTILLVHKVFDRCSKTELLGTFPGVCLHLVDRLNTTRRFIVICEPILSTFTLTPAPHPTPPHPLMFSLSAAADGAVTDRCYCGDLLPPGCLETTSTLQKL